MGDDAALAVLTHNVIVEELTALNEVLSLPSPLNVSVAYCGEANAYYDPDAVEVTMCIEFGEYLAELASNSDGFGFVITENRGVITKRLFRPQLRQFTAPYVAVDG